MEGAMENSFSDCDAMILCGGLGTRLRPVIGGAQKVLAPVLDTPFLGILADNLITAGFRHFIFCTGYQKDAVRSFIQERFSGLPDISYEFSEEDEPLGTGGAVKKAFSLVRGVRALVANGDTFVRLDFPAFFERHTVTGAVLTIALAQSEREDGGTVSLDSEARLVAFREKQSPLPSSYINAGVYIMEKGIERFFPDAEKFSLEEDVFPLAARAGVSGGVVTNGAMLDIGTPERYQSAGDFFSGDAV